MNYFILLSAGKGNRLGRTEPSKGLVKIGDKTLIEINLEKILESGLIDEIVVTTNKEAEKEIGDILNSPSVKGWQSKTDGVVLRDSSTTVGMTNVRNDSDIKIVEIKGSERQDSCYEALQFIQKKFDPKPDDVVIFHNVANPFFEIEDLKKLIEETKKHKASALAQKAKDTIRKVDKENLSTELIDRESLWQMQTPQALEFETAIAAFETAYKDNFIGTDDIQLAQRIGIKPKIIECSDNNFKITTPKDLELAKVIYNSPPAEESPAQAGGGGYSPNLMMKLPRQVHPKNQQMFWEPLKPATPSQKGNSRPKTQNSQLIRTGLGQDSHRFTDENKPLVLGGYKIKNHKGLEGNSDGDVILHAIFNALSQAIGKRSISIYSDDLCLKQGVTDSKEYLKIALEMVKKEDYKINNLGIMIECKTPKIEPIHNQMKKSLMEIINLKENQIGITATTGEGLTDFGKGLGIQCFVTATLQKN